MQATSCKVTLRARIQTGNSEDIQTLSTLTAAGLRGRNSVTIIVETAQRGLLP